MSDWLPTHDAVLVLRCRQGDARAFSSLIDRWHPRLLRHAARLSGDTHAAADIAQETWIAAIERLPKLDDPDAFGPWLFRILTRKSADWIRRRQSQRRLWDRLLKWKTTCSPPSPASGKCESVTDALSCLPREQAEVIGLHYLEEFSVLEIAEIVGVPPGTVKSRLHYARLRLRELLKEPDHEQR